MALLVILVVLLLLDLAALAGRGADSREPGWSWDPAASRPGHPVG